MSMVSVGNFSLILSFSLPLLALQVKHVYERCGFDASSSPTTLYMLSDLEARLEDLLSDIAQMPEEYVAKAEKVSRTVPTPRPCTVCFFSALRQEGVRFETYRQ